MRQQMAWGDGAYAGFWQRVAGYVVDTLILIAAAMLLSVAFFVVVGGVAASGDEAEAEALAGVVGALVSIAMVVAFFLYDTLMTSRTGATLGKRAAGIEVRTSRGELPSFGVCTGRFFGRYLSALPLWLGYLWMLWDPQRQTWHDKLCDTFVVKRDALVPVGSWNYQPMSGWGAQTTVPAGSWSSPAMPPAGSWSPPTTPAGTRTPSVTGTSAAGQHGPPAQVEQAPDERPPGDQGTGDAPWAGVQGETMETATWGRPAARPLADPPEGRADDAADGVPAVGGAQRGDGRPDPNAVAIDRARLAPDAAGWLRQIAGQVDARLDRVSDTWRSSPQADAARACAFGILIGHLARVHPHMAGDLGRVAEAHPSFSTLLEGSRLDTLVEIAAEPGRATAWLGPLIDVTDRERIAGLLA